MRVIAAGTIRRYVAALSGHRDRYAVEQALSTWLEIVKRSRWSSSADIKRFFVTASIVDAERVVFNIKGNQYRLVTSVNYAAGIVYVKWFGSHAAYDRIDVRTVKYDD